MQLLLAAAAFCMVERLAGAASAGSAAHAHETRTRNGHIAAATRARIGSGEHFAAAERYACRSKRTQPMGFCDSSRSATTRVVDLLERLSTAEKLSLMGAHGNDICAFQDGGVPRLDIPSYTWCTETNTGVSTICVEEGRCATSFPSPTALAASFNRTLWRAKGVTQSTEQRALFNLGAVRGDSVHSPIGLNGWGPNINTLRDPKYGRNSELPSEDPTLNGEYAVQIVRGMQEGDDPRWPLKIHATLKHYTAYSVETNRFGYIGNASTYDVHDSFLPQYAMGFQRGKAGGAMCSYTSLRIVNATTPKTVPLAPAHPSCASEFLLNHMIREEWGQEEALIVTDCEAVAAMYQHNHLATDVVNASAKSINAGVDLNTGFPFFQHGGLNEALRQGSVDMATIDRALNRSLLWKFRLGLFDDPTTQHYARLGMESVNATSAQHLVQEAAAQGLVLLRNNDSVLPLGEGHKVAVVGSHALATRSLLSSYYGDEVCFGAPPHSSPKTADGCIATIGASVAATNAHHGGDTRISPGVGVTEALNATATAEALAAVAWSDVTILAVGLNHDLEHEGIDRHNTDLPTAQLEFALRVLGMGKPIVLIMINGGIISIDDLLHPPTVYQGNCTTTGVYERGIDIRNTVNQTWAPLGKSGSVEACCALCARRTNPCQYFTYATDTTDCYLKASGAGRREASTNLISGSCVRTNASTPATHGPAAILEAFYPNQAGASAIGPALWGETNRFGKLPVTIYGKEYGAQMPIQELEMRADATRGYPGRGYRYYTGEPLFAAFSGLSYTTYETTCSRGEEANSSRTLTLLCTVKNTGSRDGDAVLLLFHRPPQTAAGAPSLKRRAPRARQRPIRRLIDFQRVAVPVGQSSSPEQFNVDIPGQLSLVDEDGVRVEVPGVHVVEVQDGPRFEVVVP